MATSKATVKNYTEQSGYRTNLSSEIVGDDLIIWGGNQDGLPLDHYSEEKQSITTNLNILNLPKMEWNNVSTAGTPPAGSMDYSTAIIGEELYVFGGRCDRQGDCVHNDLHQLNASNEIWKFIPCTNKPIKKHSCGFISYSYQGSDCLLALGGEGGKQVPTKSQLHSLYTPNYGRYWTNEVHIMNITTSPGKWISPTVTGDRPPPISRFTFNKLPNDRSKAVLFGGMIVPETNKSHYNNDIYIISLTSATVNFTKISPQQPHSLWPKPRDSHSSTIITNGSEDHLLVIGGWYDDDSTLADCWVLNITTKKWSQIDLPQSVCGRWYHSVSSVTMNTNTQWIIVTGGMGMEGNCIQGGQVTMIVELEYVSRGWLVRTGEWVVHGVWNSTQKMELTERMKRIQPTKKLPAKNETLTKRIDQMRQEIQQLKQQLHTSQQIQQQQNTELADKQKMIEQLQADILEKDSVIERHENTIAFQRKDSIRYHDNPSWQIDQKEVVMTQEVLGRGGWGEVKVGVFRGTRVAVKTIHYLILSNYNLQFFSREMDIASHVRHPNLLQFIGATRMGNPQILTELMPTSLRKELEKSPMTRPQVLSVGIDVASGLNYLHCWKPCPILHRDISSANVLLEPSGNGQWKAKLADYGSANLVENVQTTNPGSPVYSAPEAINPAHHSPAMDVYSFGILMIEMATGQFPPSVQHEKEALIQDVRWPPFKALIIRCTSTVPSSRPTTDNALLQLRNIID